MGELLAQLECFQMFGCFQWLDECQLGQDLRFGFTRTIGFEVLANEFHGIVKGVPCQGLSHRGAESILGSDVLDFIKPPASRSWILLAPAAQAGFHVSQPLMIMRVLRCKSHDACRIFFDHDLKCLGNDPLIPTPTCVFEGLIFESGQDGGVIRDR